MPFEVRWKLVVSFLLFTSACGGDLRAADAPKDVAKDASTEAVADAARQEAELDASGEDAGAPAPDAGEREDAGTSAASYFLLIAGGTKIARSDDGVTWTVVNDDTAGVADFDTENLFRGACAGRTPSGEAMALVVGGGTGVTRPGTPGRIARSTDGGRTFQHEVRVNGGDPTVLVENANWFGGCGFGNGRIVVVGAYHSLTSTDGVSWTLHTPSTRDASGDVDFYARDGRFGAGMFVAVGQPGIYTSEDGESWKVVSRASVNRVFEHGGVWLAVLERESKYYRSTNGEDWTELSAPAPINRFAHDGSRFLASSHTGVMLTSSDGTSFVVHEPADGTSLTGIAFGKGTYVSVLGSESTLYFKGSAGDAPLLWKTAAIPGDAEGVHDKSLYFLQY